MENNTTTASIEAANNNTQEDGKCMDDSEVVQTMEEEKGENQTAAGVDR